MIAALEQQIRERPDDPAATLGLEDCDGAARAHAETFTRWYVPTRDAIEIYDDLEAALTDP